MHARWTSKERSNSLPRLRSRPHHLRQLAQVSLRRARWVTLGLVSLLLASCAAKPVDLTGAVATRTLPPVSDIIPADAARPPVSAKDDARVVMQRFAAWGDAEKARLAQARRNYGDLVRAEAEGKP